MRRFSGFLVALFLAPLLIPLSSSSDASEAAAGPPSAAQLAAIAATLPPLPADGAVVSIPLSTTDPFAWRGVRGGIAVDAAAAGGVKVAYTVVAGAPAGAALLVRPGSLAGIEALLVSTTAERVGSLMVTLQNDVGVSYAFPALSVRPGGLRETRLEVADLTYLAPASSAPDPGEFDLAETVMISVIDLAGFMGGAEVATSFTLGAFTAHRTSEVALVPTHPVEVRGAAGRHPTALAAEARFFAVFNHGAPREREAPLRELMIAFLSDPSDGRTALLLGLNHLWIAAEGDRTNPRVVENLLLAERFLATAQTLAPNDRRVPSWLVPTRLALADLERRPELRESLIAELLAEYELDREFHAFSVAMLGFDEPRGSVDFQRGLDALRGVAAECAVDDVTCQNTERWPHNIEAYLTFVADYELKAGELDRSRELLAEARAVPSFTSWPLATEVDDRLANLELYANLYADSDHGNDPPSILSAARGACGSCHFGG